MLDKLHQKALEAQENSYSPYSKFRVGSAIQFKGLSEIFTGCNIENASFGGTVCAERVAILKGISEHKKQTIESVVVVTDSPEGDPPCGLCLQTISEFSDADTKIHIANKNEILRTYTQKELLPISFKLEN